VTKQRIVLFMTPVLLPLFALLAYIGYVQYERLPWIDIAVHLHAQRGAVNCGHIVGPWRNESGWRSAMDCAVSAAEKHRPFFLILTRPSIDDTFSTAVVADSGGTGVEILYSTGMEIHADTIFRHRCDSPIRLDVETGHCAPWPPTKIERDRLLW